MTSAPFCAKNAKTAQPIALAMQRLSLTGEVLPVGASLHVRHEFQSAENEVLEVVYAFMLPRDATLRRFRAIGEGFEATSQLRPKAEAVKTYERGIAEGALSVLARTHQDGVVNLSVGNIRPGERVMVDLEIVAGVEARDDGFRFRFPFTLAPTYHAQARMAVNERGEGELELPPETFGDVLMPTWRPTAAGLHEIDFELALRSEAGIDEVASPSHPIRVRTSERRATARLASGGLPDADLVLDVRWAEAKTQVFAAKSESGTVEFAALVPSSAFATDASVALPRRVAILLDRSGSMKGAPIQQARKAIEACLAVLEERDQFALLAFDNVVEQASDKMLAANSENRSLAANFLAGVDARGGTELSAGFEKAAELLGSDGGEVFILTDGQVSGVSDILSRARACGARLHCLGIGSASQDRFLTQLARETGGVSRFVTASERVDLEALELFANVGHPVAAGVESSGNLEPAAAGAVHSGTPLTLYGTGEVCDLKWRNGGAMHIAIEAQPVPALAESVRLLRGARLISDWESRGESERIAERLRVLSERYGLASREMPLVAVVTRAGDSMNSLPETRVVALGMPQAVEFTQYFAGAATRRSTGLPAPAGAARAKTAPQLASGAMKPRGEQERSGAFLQAYIGAPSNAEPDETDQLVELAGKLQPDGGMPGPTDEERLLHSLYLLLALLEKGHTPDKGALRKHAARLAAFVAGTKTASTKHAQLAARVLERVKANAALPGDWLKTPEKRLFSDRWKQLEQAMGAGAAAS